MQFARAGKTKSFVVAFAVLSFALTVLLPPGMCVRLLFTDGSCCEEISSAKAVPCCASHDDPYDDADAKAEQKPFSSPSSKLCYWMPKHMSTSMEKAGQTVAMSDHLVGYALPIDPLLNQSNRYVLSFGRDTWNCKPPLEPQQSSCVLRI